MGVRLKEGVTSNLFGENVSYVAFPRKMLNFDVSEFNVISYGDFTDVKMSEALRDAATGAPVYSSSIVVE